MLVARTLRTVERKLTLSPGVVHGAALCLVMLLGAVLRLYNLGTESYWLDEVSMLRVAGGTIDSIVLDTRENGRPPVYVLFAHFWIHIFGQSEVATRSLSAIFSIASLGVMYL